MHIVVCIKQVTDPEAPTSMAVKALAERLIQICGGIRPRTVDGDAGICERFRNNDILNSHILTGNSPGIGMFIE